MTQNTEPPSVERMEGPDPTFTISWSQDVLVAMNSDPSISYWLKRAIADLSKRDPLDALYDAELLCALMKNRWETWTGMNLEAKGEDD